MPKEEAVVKNRARQWFASYLESAMKGEAISPDTKDLIGSAARCVYADKIRDDADFRSGELRFCKVKRSKPERKAHFDVVMTEIAGEVKNKCAALLRAREI